MKKRFGLLLFWLCCLPLWATAQSPVTGFCEKGGQAVVTNGVSSSTKVQRTFVGCTVSVFDAGSTNLSTIFSDGVGTPKANPFTADATTGYWAFYANNGSYDVSITATGLGATTIRTVKIADASSSPLSGSGTSGRVPKWSGTSSITNSQITDNATSVGINNTSPAASALLDLTSTTQGLLPPRLTTTQRDAIASPANGLFIYNSTTGQFNGFQAGVWGAIGGSAGAGITSLNGLTGASQTFVNSSDTNVTLGIASAGVTHTFTLGWTGTLAKTRTLGTTVYTDQGNTFSAGAQDFSAASSFTVPVAGGTAPTVSGRMAYDSTSNTLEYGANGVNRTVVNLSESQTLSNKTLTAPNIGDFTGAQHSHQNTAGGGLLDVAAIGSGVFSTARGGTNTTSASYSTNGAFYYDGSKFITTAAGGAGTLCLQATDGGVPTFGACSGTAATALSALTAATTSNTLNSGDNAQIWKWTLTTSSKTGWRISENTASAAAGTPFLVAIDTLSASTVNPFQVTAGGTANGVRVDTTGKLAKIGTGSVTADALNGLSANGWLVQTSTGNFTARTLAAGEGIGITNLDGTGGNPSFTWSPSTQVSSFSLFDGSQASRTETINLSGTDPVYTFTSNKVELTTGNFQAPLFDKGGQVYFAKAYGVTCDGSTDDTTAIQTAINAVPTTGGILVLPVGVCKVTSGLTYGDGTSTTSSSRTSLTIVGQGDGATAAEYIPSIGGANAATILSWFGAAGGTMLTLNGATSGLRIENIFFEAQGGANAAATAINAKHVMNSTFRNLTTQHHTGFAYILTAYPVAVGGVADGADDNVWERVSALNSGTNGGGIQLGAAAVGGGILDVARNTFQTCHFSHNGTGAGVELRFADANSFVNTYISSLKITATTDNVNYPSGTSFYNCPIFAHSVSGTWTPTNKLTSYPFPTTDGEPVPTNTGFGGITDTMLVYGAPQFRDGITGTTTNDSAATGKVGEYIESVITSGSAVALTSATSKTITSISLTAGDWDLGGEVFLSTANTMAEIACSYSLITNTFDPTVGKNADHNSTLVTGGVYSMVLPTARFSLSGTTTIFLVGYASFSTGSQSAYGYIRARRLR